MVKLSKFVDNWINADNYASYVNKKLIVQRIQEEEGRFGTRLVMHMKNIDDDVMLKMTLNKTALNMLLKQGYDDTDMLIGKQVKLRQTVVRGKVAIYVEVIEDGKQ